ncbi:MAG: hypothetical protein RLZZ584_1541, partial [Pseudomonadota bacterium]
MIGRRSVELLIHFGQPIHEFDGGLEAQYESLLNMEDALRTKASQTAAVLYRETIMDEDRVEAWMTLRGAQQVAYTAITSDGAQKRLGPDQTAARKMNRALRRARGHI